MATNKQAVASSQPGGKKGQRTRNRTFSALHIRPVSQILHWELSMLPAPLQGNTF